MRCLRQLDLPPQIVDLLNEVLPVLISLGFGYYLGKRRAREAAVEAEAKKAHYESLRGVAKRARETLPMPVKPYDVKQAPKSLKDLKIEEPMLADLLDNHLPDSPLEIGGGEKFNPKSDLERIWSEYLEKLRDYVGKSGEARELVRRRADETLGPLVGAHGEPSIASILPRLIRFLEDSAAVGEEAARESLGSLELRFKESGVIWGGAGKSAAEGSWVVWWGGDTLMPREGTEEAAKKLKSALEGLMSDESLRAKFSELMSKYSELDETYKRLVRMLKALEGVPSFPGKCSYLKARSSGLLSRLRSKFDS